MITMDPLPQSLKNFCVQYEEVNGLHFEKAIEVCVSELGGSKEKILKLRYISQN